MHFEDDWSPPSVADILFGPKRRCSKDKSPSPTPTPKSSSNSASQIVPVVVFTQRRPSFRDRRCRIGEDPVDAKQLESIELRITQPENTRVDDSPESRSRPPRQAKSIVISDGEGDSETMPSSPLLPISVRIPAKLDLAQATSPPPEKQSDTTESDPDDEQPIQVRARSRPAGGRAMGLGRRMILMTDSDEDTKHVRTIPGDLSGSTTESSGSEDGGASDVNEITQRLGETILKPHEVDGADDLDDLLSPFATEDDEDAFGSSGLLIYEGDTSTKAHRIPLINDDDELSPKTRRPMTVPRRHPTRIMSSDDEVNSEDPWFSRRMDDCVRTPPPAATSTPKKRVPVVPLIVTPVRPGLMPISKKAFKERKEEMAREFFAELNPRARRKGSGSYPRIPFTPTPHQAQGEDDRCTYAGFISCIPCGLLVGWSVDFNTERLRETLAHELCHAATWIINGVDKPPHGKVFKYCISNDADVFLLSWFHRGRLTTKAFPDITVTTCHHYEIDYKYRWTCMNPACGKTSITFNLTEPNSLDQRYALFTCFARFFRRLKTQDKVKKDGTPFASRQPNKFQLYLKENFKRIKNLHPRKTHAEIMAILSNEYKASKAFEADGETEGDGVELPFPELVE
ncbi:hypothetical protein BC936DRAFT_136690 [Jimgerdemannia flammicorona]|uniref:SprT-like domain-containing protein n=1 Tax=Jimgerdemannia flammicorona TaxID=994334 RepID=A0A433CZ18_9FUNG|nr:hypothetical protein BC936DRAFT_136690 [Jimgerdemannia flammicorona]